MNLFDVDFLRITLLDVVDITLVALLLYGLYRLLRGTLALNTAVGFALVYGVSLIVKALNLALLSYILSSFTQVGVVLVVVVFSQEIRQFLQALGRGNALKVLKLRFRTGPRAQWAGLTEEQLIQIRIATYRVARQEDALGALIVLTRNDVLELGGTGVPLRAQIGHEIIESIFQKTSPLHDGALVVQDGCLWLAGGVLPIRKGQLDMRLGLRHRAALGLAERSDAVSIVVSEERRTVSVAYNRRLHEDIQEPEFLEWVKAGLMG